MKLLMIYYLKKNIFNNLKLGLITIVWAGVNVFSSIVLAWLLDSLINKSWKMFIIWAMVDILCWVVYSLFQTWKDILKEKIVQKQLNDIRADILHNITEYKNPDDVLQNNSEYQSWLINDMNVLRENGYLQLYGAIESVITILFNSFAIIYFHWSLLLATILLTFITYFSPKLFQKRIDQTTDNYSTSMSESLDKVEDYFKGFQIFYYHHALSYFKSKSLSFFDNTISSRIHLTFYTSFANSISMIVSIISQVTLFILSGYLIVHSIISVGVIFSIANLSSCIFNYTRGAAYNIVTAKSTAKLLEKYAKIIPEENQQTTKAITAFKDKISFNDVKVKFASGKELSIPNFEINKNEKIAIIGESGAGKTTLIKLLNGEMLHSSGQIFMDDIAYETIEAKSKANLFAYLNQQPYLLKESVHNNVFLNKTYDKSVFEKLKNYPTFCFLEKRWTEIVGNNFSGGQKSRIALLREWISDKDLFLIDEGTSALDSANAMEIEKMLLSQPDKTIIFVTHTLHDETKNMFDKIIRLK